MELRDIEYFAVVAEHGHLGRAAEALGLSTPALSKSLRRLEKALQAKLVARTPKGVELTAEGNALLSCVRPLRLSLHDIKREIADLSEGRSGHLRLGSIPGPADYLLPIACSALLNDARGVRVTVTVATNRVLVPALRNGELDMILLSIAAPPYENMIQEHLFDDELVVYAAVDHRLTRRKQVEIADLAEERWATSAPDALPWKWVQRVFEEHGLAPPRVALVSNLMHIRREVIASSDVLGFAPRRSLRQVAPHLRLTDIPVKELTWTRHVGVGYRKDAYLSPTARRFIEILKKTAKEIAKEK